MASAATGKPDLKLVPGGQPFDETGEVYVPSSELAELQQQLEDLQRAHAKELANVRRLKRQLEDQQLEEAEGPLIMEVLEHWAKAMGTPDAEIPLTGRRAAAVRKRLKEMVGAKKADRAEDLRERQQAVVEHLKRVADGAAKFPYEAYGERFCELGTKAQGRKRRADAIYIYANEKRIQELEALADVDNGHEAYAKWLHGECKRDPVLLRSLARLGVREPHGEVIARAVVWAAKMKSRAPDKARAAVLRSRV